MIYESFKFPELELFMKRSMGNKTWHYSVKYMTESNQNQIGMIIIEKDEYDNMKFSTYSILNGKYMMKHRSRHHRNGDILAMVINLSNGGFLEGIDNNSKIYLENLLSEMTTLLDNEKFSWDVIV
jgi:hypothetical protein